MAWAHARGVRHLINDAGKPTQNAYIESFNGKFRLCPAGHRRNYVPRRTMSRCGG